MTPEQRARKLIAKMIETKPTPDAAVSVAMLASAIREAENAARESESRQMRVDVEEAIRETGNLRQGICAAIGVDWIGPRSGGQRLPDDKDIIEACRSLKSKET